MHQPPAHGQAPSTPPPPPAGAPVRDILAVLVLLAAATLAGGAWLLWQAEPFAPLTWLFAGILGLAWWLLERRPFPLVWRGHRYSLSLDDAVFALCLLALPTGIIPFVGLGATISAQISCRRRGLKAALNVASHVAAVGIGIATYVPLRPLIGELPAAIAVIGVYSVLTNVVIAAVFARLEKTSFFRIWRERIARPTLLHYVLAAATGVVLIALWSYHPATLLAATPFLAVARGYLDHRVRADNVLRVHTLMQRVAQEVGRADSAEDIADSVLKAGGEIVPASRVTLVFQGTSRGSPRVWTRTFPRLGPNEWGSLQAPLIDQDGQNIGILRLEVDNSYATGAPELGRGPVGLLAAEAARAFERLERQEAPLTPY